MNTAINKSSPTPAATGEGNKNKLLQYLSNGEKNAITARQLVNIGTFASVRDVTQEVNRLRRRGIVICSSCAPPAGYYLPDTQEEIKRFCNQMDSRIIEISKAKQAAEILLKERL